MARGRKPRSWVKIDCNGILHGSINYLLTLEEQAVWIKMIAYSEICGGPAGFIQDNEGHGLPDEFLAHELHCPTLLLQSTIKKMTEDKAIRSNGTGSIELVNFPTYQFSEYDRQAPYRRAKKEASFEEFIEKELTPEFKDLDIKEELKKFRLYWSEGNRSLQRPKTAFRNWLTKAREFRQERNGTHQGSNQKVARRPEDYTTPEQLRREAGGID